MSKKQRKKQKNKNEILNARLEYLKKKAIELQSDFDDGVKKNKEALRIRNFKFFKNTCNFLTPFSICTSLSIGIIGLLGGGLPFVRDDIVKEKTYILDYQTDDSITMEAYYRLNKWYNEELPDNELIVYTPWNSEEDHYTRYKLIFELDNVTEDIMNAVINENIYYLQSEIDKYKKEKQTINVIDSNDGCYIDAYLTRIDEKDTFEYPESDKDNIITTIIELAIGLSVGALIALFRDFKYIAEMKYDNHLYYRSLTDIKLIKSELNKVNEEIATLSKKKVR